METEACGYSVINAADGAQAELLMQSLWLTGRVLPVGAHLEVVHTFRCGGKQPIELVYAFGLPRDASLRRFKIIGEGFEVESEIRPSKEAAEQYEQGVQEGSLSSLMRVYRDGRVNLSVGNIRAGEIVRVHLELVAGVELRPDGLRFRFPFTLPPCYHSSLRAAEVERGVGELELSKEAFGDLVLPTYMQEAGSLHQVGFDLSLAFPGQIEKVSSPSHLLALGGLGGGELRVGLAKASDVPNRDLVLDVCSESKSPAVYGGLCPDGEGRFAAVVPPRAFGENRVEPRSMLMVLDRSGSMQGEPILQARNALRSCLATLRKGDRFGIVAFDTSCEVWPTPEGSRFRDLLTRRGSKKWVLATVDQRDDAWAFLSGIGARGGTALALGLNAAAEMLGEEGGEVFLVTDGQVGATEEILAKLNSSKIRVHCLGIGAAAQDRFLELLARQTDGVCRCVNPDERVDLEALELFASAGTPCATQVLAEVEGLEEGRIVLPPEETAYSTRPVLLWGCGRGSDKGSLQLHWQNGEDCRELSIPVRLQSSPIAESVRLLQGARLINQLESQIKGELGTGEASDRESKRRVQKLEDLGKRYGLANRAMSLVAVVKRAGDNPDALPHSTVVPVGMPQGVEYDAYFPSPQSLMGHMELAAGKRRVAGLTAHRVEPDAFLGRMQSSEPTWSGLSDGRRRRSMRTSSESHFRDPGLRPAALKPDGLTAAADFVVMMSSQIGTDHGLKAPTEAERILHTAAGILAFLLWGQRAGHPNAGPFQVHVQGMAEFLRAKEGSLEAGTHHIVKSIVQWAKTGLPASGSGFDDAQFGSCFLALQVVLEEGYASTAKAWKVLAREVERLSGQPV